MLRLVKTSKTVTTDQQETFPVESSISVTIAREFSHPRLEIMRLLHDACEIEHSIMIQYLYAAFSVKTNYADIVGTPDPTRSDCLLGVAVQEMKHFREVNQMLVNFGGQPNMERQDFPYESTIYPFEMRLERLTRSTIAKYIYAEAPAFALDENALTNPDDKAFARAVLAELRPDAHLNHIGTLYQKVLALLAELAPEEQPPNVDLIRATLEQIKMEGENDHFHFFKSLFLGKIGSLQYVSEPWANPDSEDYPSHAVPDNPTALSGYENQIKDVQILELARQGNLHYWIILSLLHLSYASEKDVSLAALAAAQMMSALYPLCAEIARRGGGMPFDPLSLGYVQAAAGANYSFIESLLDEARLQSEKLDDSTIATVCLQAIEQTLAELTIHRTKINVPNNSVAVIGAGPAGLAAACALAAQGLPVYLFEQSNMVGGKVHSYHEENRSVEHGVHGWWINYLNFNSLLEQAGVSLNAALKEAIGTNLVQVDEKGMGSVFPLRNFRWRMPNPINLFLQNLRAPYLKLSDTFHFVRFAIHLLAFSHERDYHRYDSISFQQMMDDLRVPPRIQHLILTPFILSFDFDVPQNISAACGLSGSQFYVVHDQKSILTRWSRGLPADKIFGPLVNFFERSNGVLLLNSPIEKITIKNGEASGVIYQSKETGSPAAARIQPPANSPAQVLVSVPTAQIPNDSFFKVEISSRQQFYVSCQNGNYIALSAECTHMGCMINWDEAGRIFKCPCHGGEYNPNGDVLQGPPVKPLEKVETRLAGNVLELLGVSQSKTLSFRDVILATDTHAAQEILRGSPDLDPTLLENVEQLDTTPVIVVRLWFNKDVLISPELESAITPDAEFIDNFFFLNAFSPVYDHEGVILEVQSYRVGPWLERSDEEILAITFCDLSAFCPKARRENLTLFKVQRHRALFTKYSPGKAQFRPNVESGTGGLYLAGDWTEADWSVWMMERAVVSGLRAANAVLKRRGQSPLEIRRLPKEDIILRFSRWVCRLLRRLFWENYPAVSSFNAIPTLSESSLVSNRKKATVENIAASEE